MDGIGKEKNCDEQLNVNTCRREEERKEISFASNSQLCACLHAFSSYKKEYLEVQR